MAFVTKLHTRQLLARTSQRRRVRTILLFVFPWIIGFLIFNAIPLGVSLFYASTSYQLGGHPREIGLGNLTTMLRDPLVWKALWNSIYYTFGAVPAQLIISLGIAVLLNSKHLLGRGVFRTIFYLPTVVPMVAASVLWIALLNPFGGPVNDLLQFFHLPQPLWYESPGWAMPGLIFMSVWNVGTITIIFLAGLQDIPRALYEQAMIDGAGTWNQFRRITIPMLSPVILFNGIIALIYAMQTFTQAFVITNGGPANATLLYSIYLYQNAFEYFNTGYASALAWFYFLIILLFIILNLYMSRRWVSYEL